jgi:hypothetical protein
VSWLEKRSNDSREERLERSGGMGPERRLEEISRWSRFCKRLSEGDIDPASDELERLRLTTSTEPSTESKPQETPLQVQKFGLFSDQSCKTSSGSSTNDFFTSRSTAKVELLSSLSLHKTNSDEKHMKTTLRTDKHRTKLVISMKFEIERENG